MSILKNIVEQREAASVLEDIHGVITPADIRLGEKVGARVILDEGSVATPTMYRAWRLSPLGIELVWHDSFESLVVGQKYRIEVVIGQNTSELEGSVVVKGYHANNLKLLGLRFCQANVRPWDGSERRDKKRWICGSEYLPTGVCPNPARFNDFIFFRARDISASGIRIITSLRNKFLVPGMYLESTLSLPLVGQAHCKLKIANVGLSRESGKDVLELGCKFIQPDNNLMEIIGQYLFQFGPTVTPEELREQGLFHQSLSKHIDYKYVRTADEYRQVLELRLKAYKQVGKLAENATLEDVADVFDSRSRIVIGVHRGRVVATTRLIYNEIDDQMEHEQFIKFPNGFPRKDEICEITRVCTDPEYRGSDLLIGLFRFVAITVVQSKRRYILGCSTDKLFPLYRKIGFSVTDMAYNHASLGGQKHTVIMGDVVSVLSGYNVNPIYWNIIWGDLFDHLKEYDYIARDPVLMIRASLYRALRPLSFFLYNRTSKKKKIKRVPQVQANDQSVGR